MNSKSSLREAPTPPAVRTRPSRQTHHGIELVDEYAWLRAANWQEVLQHPSTLSGEIRDHLLRENGYCRSVLADIEFFQDSLELEMRSRLPASDISAWSHDGLYSYAERHERDANYAQLVRRESRSEAYQVMVDPNIEAGEHSYFRVGYSVHSPDHRMLAWFVDEVGSERFTIYFRDLATGKDLAHRVPNAGVGGAFSNDGDFFIYIGLDAINRRYRLCLHRMGVAPSQDITLLEESDPRFLLNVRLTQSKAWFVISSQSREDMEIHLISADDPLSPARLIVSKKTGGKWLIDEGDGILFGMTNAQEAHDYKIVTACVDDLQTSNWRELIPHRPGVPIIAHRVFKRHLVWLERHDGIPRAMVRRHSDGNILPISFGESSYSLVFGVNHTFETDAVRLVYSSMRTPATTFDCDMDTGTLTCIKTQRVEGPFQEDDYITRRIQATSTDGTRLFISLVHHRSTPINGTAPCLLHAYGAYGISLPVSFDAGRLSLLDRGFVYAIAHVRGGGEGGTQWHDQGKGKYKCNSIHDFIAAARQLVTAQYGAPGCVVAHGASAGGALVAAAANLAPEAFAGLITAAPFVDVLNTMLDADLPLTALEWQEWGNPAASTQEFEQIRCWSPYDNVAAQSYPMTLTIQGLTDPRVTYWEAAKWTARLRARQIGHSPILLRTDFSMGHTGAASRIGQIVDSALLYAFAIKAVGRVSHPDG